MNSSNSDVQEVEPDLLDTHELTEQEQILQLTKVIYESQNRLLHTQALLSVLDSKVTMLDYNLNQVQHYDLPTMKTNIAANHSTLSTRLDYVVTKADTLVLDIRSIDSDILRINASTDLINSRLADAERDIDNTTEEILEIKSIIREIQDSLFDRVNYKSIKLK